MLTLAEMAQKAYTGVVTQNGFGALYSTEECGPPLMIGCVYQADDGMRCNVGHLITEEKYAPLWTVEGNVWELKAEAFDLGIDLPWDTQDEDVDDFLSQMQQIHDECAYFPDWSLERGMELYKAKMKGFCAMHDITLVDP